MIDIEKYLALRKFLAGYYPSFKSVWEAVELERALHRCKTKHNARRMGDNRVKKVFRELDGNP